MAKYRKKPVVIDAVQFVHPAQNGDELLPHLEGCIGCTSPTEGS